MTTTLTPTGRTPESDRPFLHAVAVACLAMLFQVQGVGDWLRTGAACLQRVSAAVDDGSRNGTMTHALRQLTGIDRDRPAARTGHN
jgi:hypothetical protein